MHEYLFADHKQAKNIHKELEEKYEKLTKNNKNGSMDKTRDLAQEIEKLQNNIAEVNFVNF